MPSMHIRTGYESAFKCIPSKQFLFLGFRYFQKVGIRLEKAKSRHKRIFWGTASSNCLHGLQQQ